MIRLFSKARANSLTEGRTFRYIKYAAGEITLIVIGILIAIQLNRFNDSVNDIKLEESYLRSIIENLDTDIESLDGHIAVQIYKMNVYTLLVKAFTDEYIRSDRHLLKHAVLRSHGFYDFDPYRNAFDGMRSAGQLNLIRSADLRSLIQSYYVRTTAVVNAESIYNQQILGHQNRIFTDMINYNSLTEYGLEPKWEARVLQDDLSFFDRPVHDDQVKEFVNMVSDMKRITISIIEREEDLQQYAIAVRSMIYQYLGEESASESVQEDPGNFTPNIPHNLLAVSDEVLSDYTGRYEPDRADSSSTDTSETDHVFIEVEDNHLVVYFPRSKVSHSYYLTRPDEFRQATSFLFDDLLSEGSLHFIRNDEQQISGLTVRNSLVDTAEYYLADK